MPPRSEHSLPTPHARANTTQSGGAPVSRALFQSATLPVSDRFDVWRESVLPLFESIPDEAPERFSAQVESYDLRHTAMAMSAFSSLRFHRDRHHRAADGADHLLVQLYVEGGYVGHNGYREVCVRPGDISLLDLGRELETRAAASNALSLIIPREQLYTYASPERLAYGSVLRGATALGSILGNHLLTVWQYLPSARVEEIDSINHLLLSSVVGAFTSAPTDPIALPERVTQEAIRAYIAQNLAEPLTPDMLCRRFACSRAQLYRLFQPLGGVVAYIRDARLNRCWQELSESADRPKRIGDVAMRWGFASQSHFNRLFRQAFGMAPGEAVERAQSHCHARGDLDAVRADGQRPALHELLRRL